MLSGISFVISALSYAVALCCASAQDSPGSVAVKLGMRVMLYPLNYFITYFPGTLALLLFQSNNSDWEALMVAGLLCQSMNGLLNVLTYAFIFYGARKIVAHANHR